MYCEIRVSNFSGDIEDLTRRYSEDFAFLPVGRRDVEKYSLTITEDDRSYLIMVSQCDVPNPDYSIILSVMGPIESKVKELMQKLTKNFRIETKPAPDHLRDLWTTLLKYI